jgi:hypothetical protein
VRLILHRPKSQSITGTTTGCVPCCGPPRTNTPRLAPSPATQTRSSSMTTGRPASHTASPSKSQLSRAPIPYRSATVHPKANALEAQPSRARRCASCTTSRQCLLVSSCVGGGRDPSRVKLRCTSSSSPYRSTTGAAPTFPPCAAKAFAATSRQPATGLTEYGGVDGVVFARPPRRVSLTFLQSAQPSRLRQRFGGRVDILR